MEQELLAGISRQQQQVPGDMASNSCLWIRREIQDISLDDAKARDYVNLNASGTALDTDSKDQLDAIKATLEEQVLNTRTAHKI